MSGFKFNFVALCLAIFIISLSGSAWAEEAGSSDQTRPKLGLTALVRGAPFMDYDVEVTPIPLVIYEGEYFYMENLEGGVRFLNFENFDVAAYLRFDPTRFNTKLTDNRQLKRLNNRHDGFLLGGRMRLKSEYGLLSLYINGDISGHTEGLSGQLNYTLPVTCGPLKLTPLIGLYWNSSDYNNYYYGISAKNFRDSGLAIYEPGASFAPYLGLTVELSLTERWALFGQGQLYFFPSEIKDSPMVSKSNNSYFSLGLTYQF